MSKQEEQIKQKSVEAIAKKSKSLKQLKIEWLPLKNLKPNWYNPNRQSDYEFELLCKSMKEDGFTQPIVALKDGTIVDGEHRWRAAEALGVATIPVVVVEMSKEQMRMSTLRHNRARGSEDMELMGRVMQDLVSLGAKDWAQDSLMLDDAELGQMFDDISREAGTHPKVEEVFEKEEEDKERRHTKEYIPPSEQGSKLFITKDKSGKEIVTSLTPEAADLLRKREKELTEARSEESREFWRQATSVVTFAFVYAGEEAKVIRAVLGDAQAARVLELCKREHDRMTAS